MSANFARFAIGIITLSLTFTTQADEPEPIVKPEFTPDRKLRTENKFGLIFIYRDDKEINKFLTETPCVSGVWWKYHKEDEKHWIGELHYPTENTANYGPDAKNGSPQYYMVFNIAIRKESDLPIDLTKYRGALVLRDPKPDTPLSVKGDGTSYEVVAYENESATKKDFGFLFSRHNELRYKPKTE